MARRSLLAATLLAATACGGGQPWPETPTGSPTSSATAAPSPTPTVTAPPTSSEAPSTPTAAQSTPTAAGSPTASPTASPSPTPTAGPPAVPLAGFGEISGACGVIEPSDLSSPATRLIENAIDFQEGTYGVDVLSEGGVILYETPNAGGSSQESEVIAYELLYRCELAALVKTETQIDYDDEGSITDMLVRIDGAPVGVSVTRAVTGPGQPYPIEEATRVLTKKLEGINESSDHVSEADAWVKQILHVVALNADFGATMADAWALADPGLVGDTIVIITVTDGDDAFIY